MGFPFVGRGSAVAFQERPTGTATGVAGPSAVSETASRWMVTSPAARSLKVTVAPTTVSGVAAEPTGAPVNSPSGAEASRSPLSGRLPMGALWT